jgi:hypothetical protein
MVVSCVSKEETFCCCRSLLLRGIFLCVALLDEFFATTTDRRTDGRTDEESQW